MREKRFFLVGRQLLAKPSFSSPELLLLFALLKLDGKGKKSVVAEEGGMSGRGWRPRFSGYS